MFTKNQFQTFLKSQQGPIIGHGTESCTKFVEKFQYEIEIDNQIIKIGILDSPGLLDTSGAKID